MGGLALPVGGLGLGGRLTGLSPPVGGQIPPVCGLALRVDGLVRCGRLSDLSRTEVFLVLSALSSLLFQVYRLQLEVPL